MLWFSPGNGRPHESHLLVGEGQLEKLEYTSSQRAKKSEVSKPRFQSAEPDTGAAFSLEVFTPRLRGRAEL